MSTDTPDRPNIYKERFEAVSRAVRTWQEAPDEGADEPLADASALEDCLQEEGLLLLEQPAELGLSWPDGGDLLACDGKDITLYPRGVDEWGLSPDEARELAAQLVAMADACEDAGGGEPQ